MKTDNEKQRTDKRSGRVDVAVAVHVDVSVDVNVTKAFAEDSHKSLEHLIK